VQTVVQICPAVVLQLLEALRPQHRQHLAQTLTQLRYEYEQQHDQDDGVCQVDHEAAAALVEHLQQMSEVDVLLIMTVTSQQQWAADVSFALMQGVLGAGRYVKPCKRLYRQNTALTPLQQSWQVYL
jgi:hypothetical protein